MAVSEVTIKYAARGAKAAQKADENVRDSIQQTADVAREEAGTINRWMQRHRAALIGIGAAAAGAMAAIIQASPTLSAEMATVRLGFSLLAMQIGQDLAPAFRTLSELSLGLADAYSDIPDGTRKVISAVIGLSLAFGAVLGVVGAVGPAVLRGVKYFKSLGGTLKKAVIWALKRLAFYAGYAVGFLESLVASGGAAAAAGYAMAAAIGAVIGLIGVWILKVTGVLDAIKNLGRWIGNILPNWVRDAITTIIGIFAGPLAAIGGFVIGFIEGGFSKGFARAKEIIMIFVGAASRTLGRIVDTVSDIFNVLTDIGGGVWNATVNILGGALDLVNDIVSALQTVVSRTWNTVVDIVMTVTEPLTNAARNAGEGFRESNPGAADFIHTGFTQNPIYDAGDWVGDQFADGGIVTGPTTALIGEAGDDEAVLPLSKLDSMLANSGGGGGGGTSVVFRPGAIQINGVPNAEAARNGVRDAATELGQQFESRSNI